jgi:antitoxin (DNA-binding transcriptional repressor) of toxin-antitoxin stability system
VLNRRIALSATYEQNRRAIPMSAATVKDLRRDLAKAASTVAFGKERPVVERHGKPPMALVPLEDLDVLNALEDEGLIALADQAEPESAGQARVPLARVLQESERVP